MERIRRRVVGNNVWLSDSQPHARGQLARLPAHGLNYEVTESEEAVGREMLAEIEAAAQSKEGDLTIFPEVENNVIGRAEVPVADEEAHKPQQRIGREPLAVRSAGRTRGTP